MESTTKHRIYEDIARRTDGDIYIGGNVIIGLKLLSMAKACFKNVNAGLFPKANLIVQAAMPIGRGGLRFWGIVR